MNTNSGENIDFERYQQHYNEDSFWEKLKKFALRAGSKVIVKALELYYALQNDSTPKWARGVIIGALGYFILPLDLIPDAIQPIGFGDDALMLTAALATVASHISPEIKDQARTTAQRWFHSDELQDAD